MKELLEKYICACTCACKNCPLFCIVAGAVMFVLGLFFAAQFIQVIWFIIAIVAIAWGVVCLVMKPKTCVCPTKESKKETE